MDRPPVIVWFRDDLRLSDHPALSAAAKSGRPVIGLYVLDEESVRPLGGAARWWLAQSLCRLQASLKAAGADLVLRRGAAAKVISEVARAADAGAVFWNEIAQTSHLAVAKAVEAGLAKAGIDSQSFAGDLLAPPRDISNKDRRGLRVFTPFWRRLQALGDPPAPLPAPKRLTTIAGAASETLEDWKLEPRHSDWAGGLRETWTPGETAAQRRLEDFLADRRR
jgi:deoxyribodipyrimidine photo-lyase